MTTARATSQHVFSVSDARMSMRSRLAVVFAVVVLTATSTLAHGD